MSVWIVFLSDYRTHASGVLKVFDSKEKAKLYAIKQIPTAEDKAVVVTEWIVE